jgi:hypothetical protein
VSFQDPTLRDEFSFDVVSKEFSIPIISRGRSLSMRLGSFRSRTLDLPEILDTMFRSRIHSGFDMIFLSRAGSQVGKHENSLTFEFSVDNEA